MSKLGHEVRRPRLVTARTFLRITVALSRNTFVSPRNSFMLPHSTLLQELCRSHHFQNPPPPSITSLLSFSSFIGSRSNTAWFLRFCSSPFRPSIISLLYTLNSCTSTHPPVPSGLLLLLPSTSLYHLPAWQPWDLEPSAALLPASGTPPPPITTVTLTLSPFFKSRV